MKTLNIMIAAVFLMATAPAHAGAAVCYGTEETPQGRDTDAEYFARWSGSGHGRAAERVARQDWAAKYRGNPSCTSSQDLESGYLVIIEAHTRAYTDETVVTMAAGFGRTADEAEDEAVAELGRRNWSWKQRDGYTTIFDKRF
ncbi:MAG: hypothetical protein WD081_04565 [Gammaproteobacteria bacterium]